MNGASRSAPGSMMRLYSEMVILRNSADFVKKRRRPFIAGTSDPLSVVQTPLLSKPPDSGAYGSRLPLEYLGNPKGRIPLLIQIHQERFLFRCPGFPL